jgi:hypothetical protein
MLFPINFLSTRKNSEENINLLDFPSPYLIRKRKFQKFLRSSKSPGRTLEKRLRWNDVIPKDYFIIFWNHNKNHD